MKLTYTLLFVAAIWLIQCLVGGTRLVYSLPSYGILAVAGLLSLASLRRPIPKPSMICLGTTAVFFAYILARAAASPVDYLWWTDFYMVLACLVAYLLTAFYISNSRLRMLVIVGLLVLALAEFLVGLRQFAEGDNWMPFGFVRSDYGSRASGMFISSIHLAGYLETVGVLALSLAVWSSWSVWARIALGYMTVVCYAGVAITGSRGGYLSSVFSLLVFTAISLWVRRSVSPGRFARTALITGVALVAFVGAAVTVMQRSDLLRTRLATVVAKDIRFYNWQAALDQFKVSPVIGTGAGTHLYYGRFFRRPQIQWDPEHAHSDYLEILAEYGLVGLVGITVFVFVHLNSCLRAAGAGARNVSGDFDHSLRDNRLALQIGAISAISAIGAHSVTDFNLHIPGNALLFAFIFGITANPDGATYPDSASAPGARLFQGLLVVLSIGILASGLPKLPGDYWCERARISMHYRDYPAAVEFARKSQHFEKRNPDSHHLLAGAYAGLAMAELDPVKRRNLLESSIAESRASLQLFPYDEHALMRLARVLDEAKRFREAGEAYRKAIALDPNLASIHALYAKHLTKVGRLDEAEQALNKANLLRAPNSVTKGTPLDALPE